MTKASDLSPGLTEGMCDQCGAPVYWLTCDGVRRKVDQDMSDLFIELDPSVGDRGPGVFGTYQRGYVSHDRTCTGKFVEIIET